MTNQPNETRRDIRSVVDAFNADRAGSRPWVISTGERQTMTLTELARVLGISRTSCYEYARRKELPVPVVRIGRRLLCLGSKSSAFWKVETSVADDRTVLWNEGHMKGGIRQRSPRSWELSIELARDKTTGRRRQKLVTVRGGSYRRAVEVRTRLLAERNAGEFIEPIRITVAELLERWSRDYVASHVRPKTAEGYESIIRLRLVPASGALKLVQLSGAHIMALYDAMRSQDGRRDGKRGPLSERSIMQTHRVLKQALQHAMKWALLRHNPGDAVEAPRLPQKEMGALSIEKTRKILALSAGTDIGPLVNLRSIRVCGDRNFWACNGVTSICR